MVGIEKFAYRRKIRRYIVLLILLVCPRPGGSDVWGSQYPAFSHKSDEYRHENVKESPAAEGLTESNPDLQANLESSSKDLFGLAQLISEAEVVHSKLNRILSDYYFRIYRVNLDTKCRSRPLSNSCSSQKNFISLNKDSSNTQQSLFSNGAENHTASQCSKHTAGGAGGTNGNGGPREGGSGIQKCHVDRCNSSEIPFSIMGLKKENYVLRFSESSLNNKFAKFGFSPEFFERSPFVSDNVVFVDLLRNPPSYTGYNGAHDWRFIYNEIDRFENISCMQNLHLYKLISGMQASISAFSSINYECVNPLEAYENQSELPRYQSNYAFYSSKLARHKDRMENIFYTYRYLLAAVARVVDYLSDYSDNLQLVNHELYLNLRDFLKFIYTHSNTSSCDCRFGSNNANARAENGVQDCCTIVDSKCGPEVLEKFNKIMQFVDCVDCEKCRLHGKLKLSSIQSAIKILSYPADKLSELELDRNDLVALLHGLDYFAQSVLIIEKFEQHRKRQVMLYPLRILLALLLVLIVLYRREIFSATSRNRSEPKSTVD